QLESEHALVRWLSQHILEPDSNASSQQMRLESDKRQPDQWIFQPFRFVDRDNLHQMFITFETHLLAGGITVWLEDILHISELLQEAGTQLESEHALVRW
ncbi:hypothetical protein ACUOFC_53545, partial [Escherichia sp. TWPC-MK]